MINNSRPAEIDRSVQRSVGGVHTHILLEFSREVGHGALLYLGSALSLSYSVYREKTPVFNCGSHLIDGFSIANKYVAGSLISVMYEFDEFAAFLNQIEIDQKTSYKTASEYRNAVGIKEFHTFMRDDLIPFNIHALFTNEYSGDMRKIVIYDATFMNNGQVMSIEDLITENTLQYVARDIAEQHSLGETKENHVYAVAKSASSLVNNVYGTGHNQLYDYGGIDTTIKNTPLPK
ncbi:MAG: hypothetical protein DRQ78_00080 [Epsilonproteobacteria bacterium]|nr:MAG: hypothetical protein DRQ78_00080 [Campylobacterota bacterium]